VTPAAPTYLRSSPARALALSLAAVTCCLVAGGCASFDKALGQQQVDVYFKESASVAYKLHVRAACNNLPNVHAQAIATGVPIQSAIDVVVYDTTGAGDADIARLEECLNKFSPIVEGINTQDSSDDS
jgi:hypothetical protein